MTATLPICPGFCQEVEYIHVAAVLPLWNFSSIGGTIFLTLSRMSLVAEDIWGDSLDIRAR
jgi:hypothetical protein